MKLKTGILSLGAAASVATPMAFAISCSPLLGKLGKYDSVNDGIITIQTTWSAGGAAIEALDNAIKQYNEEMSGTPGFMHVKIEHVEGGYGTIPSQMLVKIQSHDTKTLPNLYIDYPSAVGQIAPYEMAYDATSTNLQRSLFEDDFIKSNDRIAGVPSGGLYSVPLSKSTEAMVCDKPVLKYLISEIQKAYPNAVSDVNNNPIIKDLLRTTISPSDLSTIKETWGTIKAGATVTQNVINDNIFSDFTSLRDFMVATQPLFTNPGGANVLGIDSPTNYLYLISSLLSKNTDEGFLMNKNNKTGFVDFNFLKDDAEQKGTFTKAYSEYLFKPISKGAMWVGGGGAYGSTRLSKHQMAISIGSSAGLSHSVDRDSRFLNKGEVEFISPPDHIYSLENKPSDGFAWENLTSSISQGPSFNTVWVNEAENNATKKLLEWFYTHGKGTSDSVVDKFSKKSEYIVPTKGAFDDNSTIGAMVSNDYDLMSKYLWGLKMSYETVRRQLNNDKANATNGVESKMFEPPIDDSTGAMRKILDSKLKASANSFNSGGSATSPASLWSSVHKQAIIDGIISGNLSQTVYHYPNQMNRNFSDIDWTRYQYVDAVIDSWTDGDTPNVIVQNVQANSPTSPVNQIKSGDKLAIRISGIDTPEAHVKLGEIKRSKLVNGKRSAVSLDDAMVAKAIDDARAAGRPLAVYDGSHYNELHYKEEMEGIDPTLRGQSLIKALNSKYKVGQQDDRFNGKFKFTSRNIYGKYTDWKAIYVDIQTKVKNDRTKGCDTILNDAAHPNSNYDLRSVNLDDGTKLVSDLAITEGYWGYAAGQFGREQIPPGTRVRVATDGNKSYNRIVGSIFYGDYLEKNWSVEILKKGLTMPFVSDPSAVTEPSNILWENGQAIADAFNYAMDNKRGLFAYSSGNLDEHLKWILTTHGVTKYTNLLHRSEESTIYDYMKYRNPNIKETEGN